VRFDVGIARMSSIAKGLAAVPAGLALLAGWLAHRRGQAKYKNRGWIRVLLAPIVLGLGGWSAAVLAVFSFWPAGYILDRLVVAPAIGVAVGFGTYWAWVQPEWDAWLRRWGLVAALAGSLAGAWFGSWPGGLAGLMTAIPMAVCFANLSLLGVDGVAPDNENAALPRITVAGG